MSKYQIERTLVLSTAHVSPGTAAILDNGMNDIPPFGNLEWAPSMTREEGWLFRVPLNMSADDWAFYVEPYPAELRAALTLARDEGCHWILFDCDGPTVETLTEFEW